MPLNSPFGPDDEVVKGRIHLGGFVKQSIQLCNLHSHLIYKAAARTKSQSSRISSVDQDRFRALFFDMNGKINESRGLHALDPADQQAQREFLEQGCDIIPHSLAYDHMYDNFMTYRDDTRPSEAIINQTKHLVGNALF